MDDVETVKDLPLYFPDVSSLFRVYPDPVFDRFHGGKKMYKGEALILTVSFRSDSPISGTDVYHLFHADVRGLYNTVFFVMVVLESAVCQNVPNAVFLLEKQQHQQQQQFSVFVSPSYFPEFTAGYRPDPQKLPMPNL